jgi:hypothetical protein
MTLGELADKLRELAEAEKSADEALDQVNAWAGFPSKQLATRQHWLAEANAEVARLRAQTIPN